MGLRPLLQLFFPTAHLFLVRITAQLLMGLRLIGSDVLEGEITLIESELPPSF